ncbi:hypothetical protein AwDysgo_20010 [Bacteroidales bacterium]|nr:hypothetical protein AwDysgo_20010 [Bacteroidales bacterium]
MKKIIIEKIQPKSEEKNVETAERNLGLLKSNAIDCNNWKEQFPYSPKASFVIAHDGQQIYLQFTVSETEVMAMVENDNGEVWNDSCVEFFISFDNKLYYNFEFSCIGKLLLSHRENKDQSSAAKPEILNLIKRKSSLGENNFDKKNINKPWSLTAIIPKEAFWKDEIKSFDGLQAKGNFYKCGDKLSVPHYLSWAPIATDNPNFHIVSAFETLVFEA